MAVCRIHARLVRAVVDQKRIVVVKATAELCILPDSAELFQHDGLVSMCRCIKPVWRHWSWLHTKAVVSRKFSPNTNCESSSAFSRVADDQMATWKWCRHHCTKARMWGRAKSFMRRSFASGLCLTVAGSRSRTLCRRSPLTSRTRSFWSCVMCRRWHAAEGSGWFFFGLCLMFSEFFAMNL